MSRLIAKITESPIDPDLKGAYIPHKYISILFLIEPAIVKTNCLLVPNLWTETYNVVVVVVIIVVVIIGRGNVIHCFSLFTTLYLYVESNILCLQYILKLLSAVIHNTIHQYCVMNYSRNI